MAFTQRLRELVAEDAHARRAFVLSVRAAFLRRWLVWCAGHAQRVRALGKCSVVRRPGKAQAGVC